MLIQNKFAQEDRIIEILETEDSFFVDSLDEAWVTFLVNGYKQSWLVDSKKYKSRISKLYYDLYKRGLSPTKENTIIRTLVSYATSTGIQKEIYLRCAFKDRNIYYDLANEKSEMVEITSKGYSIIPFDENIIFKRYYHQKKQLLPIEGGKLNKLITYINIDKDFRLLFFVYLISNYIPDIQHPILVLYGEKGAGKSTTSKIVKELVDPSEINLIALIENDEDLSLNLEQNWLAAFDNTPNLSVKTSNTLCRAVTGGGIARRKRFSDHDMAILKIKRGMVINSIENVVSKEDLLSRSVLFELGTREGFNITDQQIFDDFQSDKPFILDKIFTIISKALRIYPTLQINIDNSLRMADFVLWGYAIAEAMGGRGEDFLDQYRANIEKQLDEAIAANTLVSAILIFMNEPLRIEWSGITSDLYREICRIAHEYGLNLHSETMPVSANVLPKKMAAYKSMLEKKGIIYEHHGHKRAGSLITLHKI